MKTCTQGNLFDFSMTRVLLAGLAGGIAEILWVMTWSAATPLHAATVAAEITRTVSPGMLAATPFAMETGLIIHLAISLVLGLVFATVLGNRLRQRYGTPGLFAGSVMALALIWAINFLVVLPVLNPLFVTLMPYTVTLGSKLLFGLAMAAVLTTGARTRLPAQEVPATG